jgi:hypothetical protein
LRGVFAKAGTFEDAPTTSANDLAAAALFILLLTTKRVPPALPGRQ